MQKPDRHPSSFWVMLSSHRDLLTQAPRLAWTCFFGCWLILSLILCFALLGTEVQHQRERFNNEVTLLAHTLDARLKTCELVLYGQEDVISSETDINHIQLNHYAEEATHRYRHIYTLGYLPRIDRHQRARYEQKQQLASGSNFQIQDYQHGAGNDWDLSKNWHRAAQRDSYLPWTLPSADRREQQAQGLDILNDQVLAPTVQRAMRSAQIEVSPAIRIKAAGNVIAYVLAHYSPSPPSRSPLMRPEEVTGVSLMLVRSDSLLSLNNNQRSLFNVTLSHLDVSASNNDTPVYQALASPAPRLLDRLLPKFERQALAENPYFPYELKVSTQMRLSMISRKGMAIAVLLAVVPSYLLLLIIVIRHQARITQEFADDSLYRTREHATVTLQAISDAVITINNDHRIEYLNPAALKHLDTNEPRALGRPLNEVFKLRYEFARHAIADPFIECLQQHKAIDLEENSYLLRPNGEKLLIEGTVSPLFDRSGGLIGGVLTFRDTAPLRRRMLEALENSETRLRQHENELARVTRITSMGEMASGIAHEINQPLSAIMSYCQASLSLLEDDEPNLELISKAIQSSVAQADRAGKIVRRLREFVSKKARHHTPVDVNHAVTNALTLAEYDLQSQLINVSYLPGSHLPLVFADTIQLEQVVLNLIRNSIDAMQGQVKQRKLLVETSYSGRFVHIKVGDNGSGISSDKLDNIFAPFFSTKASGMGLGLTICQTIIESFGGKISAHNRSSGGAEFDVELPPLDTQARTNTIVTDA
jgi:two-component system sensor histidine kinase DctS